jgi:hypothetical protein
MFIMHLAAAVDVNINDSKVYYMITPNEIYNLFKNLTPDNLGSSDFTYNDKDDLVKDTSNFSDLY